MKIANCLLVKNENNYLKEYIDYYKSIGYDNIILYDNNDIDGEYPHDIIQDYIDSGFVIYNCVRGEEKCQFRVNSECLKKYKDTFEWISFFDCDEFLTGVKNVHDWLNKMPENTEQIYINWEIYGDNNLEKVREDNYNVISRFYYPENICSYKHFDEIGKPIIKTTCNCNFKKNLCPHILEQVITVDADGNYILPQKRNKTCSTIKIAHFYTKTKEEYEKKCERDCVYEVTDEYVKKRWERFYEINNNKITQ